MVCARREECLDSLVGIEIKLIGFVTGDARVALPRLPAIGTEGDELGDVSPHGERVENRVLVMHDAFPFACELTEFNLVRPTMPD